MKTFFSSTRFGKSCCIGIAGLGCSFLASSFIYAEQADDHIELYLGGALVDGNEPTFNVRSNLKDDGFGGISSMKVSSEMGDGWDFTFKGKALAGIDDYAAHLLFTKEDVATLKFGYETTAYGSLAYGVGFQPGVFIVPFEPELYLDRAKVYAEFKLHRPDAPVYTLRYTRETRDGQKGSTIYGDTTQTGSQRNIVPSIYDIDETRDTFAIRIEKQGETTNWAAGATYEETSQDNRHVSRRRPGEAADRHQIDRDGTDNEMLSVNGSVQTRVSERLTLLSSAIWTDLKGNITGSRVYGATLDAVFDPTFPGRQARDSGFFDLLGTADLRQFVGTVGAHYQPAENWSIVPSVRFERMYQDVDTAFSYTSVGTGAGLPVSVSNQSVESGKDFNSITSEIEARFTGIKSWTFSGSILYGFADGNLEEESFRLGGTAPTLLLERETDYDQERILIKAGAHWQARQNLRLSMGAYHKFNRNDYDHIRDASGITGGDRFPAYFRQQDFKLNDVNVRATWRISSQLTSISRFDYQLGKIFTKGGVFSLRSGHTERQIISQSFNWQPASRLALQFGVNYVEDSLRTPPNADLGLPSAGIVARDRHNYAAFNLNAFYAVNAATDLHIVYNGYFSDNSYDNSSVGLPLGNDTEENTIITTLTRRVNENLTLTFTYGLYSYSDGLALNKQDYTAHVLSSRIYYKF